VAGALWRELAKFLGDAGVGTPVVPPLSGPTGPASTKMTLYCTDRVATIHRYGNLPPVSQQYNLQNFSKEKVNRAFLIASNSHAVFPSYPKDASLRARGR
jgi:hypothetical protein